MKVTLETPNGPVTAAVDDGFIANAQVDPDGVVTISFFPMERPPNDDAEPLFVGQYQNETSASQNGKRFFHTYA
jgi:hypothetical protein